MTEEQVLLDTDSRGVATITLNRAAKHNAFDDRVIARLTACFRQAGDDPEVRAVVLAASGKSFSAGADLGWMQRMAGYSHEQNRADADALAQMLSTLNTLPKPTLARVQGAAFGGAVGLVSCCDMAVAASHASFCLSEVKIGLIPATISPYVIQAMGARAARRYFLSAERFSATTAAALGLVSEVTEAAQLDAVIAQWLDALLGNGPRAVAAAKQLIADIAGRPIDGELIAETSERIAGIRVSAEGQEGLRAFLDKRKPGYVGRGS